jgi:PAS domain S-box-containing protein
MLRAWQTQQPVAVTTPRESRDDAQLARALGGTVLLAVPIRTPESPWGVLVVAQRQASPFLEDDLAVVGLLAEQTGLHLGHLLLLSQQRTLLEELQKSQDLLQAILDNAFATVYVKDREGRYLFINRAYERTFGVRRDEVIGKTARDIFPQAQADRYEADDRKVWETRQTMQVEDSVQQEDGLHTYVVVKFLLREPDGTPYAICGIATDITKSRLAEQLAAQAEELARSNRELEQFAYVASHDLQEPLRMVASYVQLLARRYKGKLDTDADEFIHYAVEGANRMQQLINDLLAYSRVSTRGRAFAPTECERLLSDVLSNLRVVIAETQATITHDPLPTVVADSTQLAQVFQNLIGNAIKFRRPGESPRIHVSAQQENGHWLFSVRDNGIGIDSQYFDRIFVIFQRLHTREEHPGTGIGLSICKRIVERHGGRIWVESQPGQGSVFYFTIPERKGTAHAQAGVRSAD